ncbi:unnamed protein product, partial [Tenebrio molitor]
EKRTTVKGILYRKQDDMEIPFSGSESTLLRLIKELGFKWHKTEDNRKVLMESYDIRLLRIKYLKQILKYRDEGRLIFYTDESYVHTTHL